MQYIAIGWLILKKLIRSRIRAVENFLAVVSCLIQFWIWPGKLQFWIFKEEVFYICSIFLFIFQKFAVYVKQNSWNLVLSFRLIMIDKNILKVEFDVTRKSRRLFINGDFFVPFDNKLLSVNKVQIQEIFKLDATSLTNFCENLQANFFL